MHLNGGSIKRREDKRFLTGRGEYLDDIFFDDEYCAIFVRSPHPHAKIKKIKTLYCGHKLSNIASKRIIIKNGFEFSHFHTVPKLSDNESGLLKMYILKEKTYEKGI